MAQSSYPKGRGAEQPLGETQWKQMMLVLGRGILDEGGNPYRVTGRDSVTDRVTIGTSTKGYNSSLLDGFVHYMDAPELIPVPPVSVDTVYEIGLVFDPTKVADLQSGPVTLTAWKAPGTTTGGVSRMVLHRMTRKPSVALGSTPVESPLPRAVPVISVSTDADLPTTGLVLVDTIALVRVTGQLWAASIDGAGNVSWRKIGAADLTGALTQADLAAAFSRFPEADKAVMRFTDGTARVRSNGDHPDNVVNIALGDARYVNTSEPIDAALLSKTGGDVPWEIVSGSTSAYATTNVGSTYASIVATPAGRFGRYPSARKYKKNITPWEPDPQTIVDMVPVTYDVKVTSAGHSDGQSSDSGLIGFTADDYADTRRELVLKDGDEVEGFHYHLLGVAQQVVLRWHEDRIKTLEADNALLSHNVAALTAHLGLDVDADGALVIEGEPVPETDEGA